MTAHDDDQELITIRIPRRAAALYATELDVASSPWMVKLILYGGIAAPAAFFLVAIALLVTGFYQAAADDLFFATNCFVMSAIAGGLSTIMVAVGFQRLRAARSRGLL